MERYGNGKSGLKYFLLSGEAFGSPLYYTTMKYEIGDIKTIIGNSNKHKFKLGEKVRVVGIPDTTSYLCEPSMWSKWPLEHKWFVNKEDLSSLVDILKQL